MVQYAPEFKRYVYDCVEEEKVSHSYLLSSGIVKTEWVVDITAPRTRYNITICVPYEDQLLHSSVLIDQNDHEPQYNNDVFHNKIADLVCDIKHHIYNIHPTKKDIDLLKKELENIEFNDIIKKDQIKEKIFLLEIELEKELDNIIMRRFYEEFKDEIDPPPTPAEQQAEEEVFEEVEQRLEHARKTFKLNLRAIRHLDKATSDKFVLPLTESDKDVEKWNQLTTKPFGFLAYNGAKFSINLTKFRSDNVFFVDAAEKEFFTKKFDQYTEVKDSIEAKREHYKNMVKKLSKASKTLSLQVDALKVQFEEKAKKHKQPKLLKFIAERTKTNIATIREAEDLVNRRIKALKNKCLTKKPTKFFKRAVRLFLGKTGDDILIDMKKVGLTSKEDYLLAIEYLYFLKMVLEKRKDQFTPPIVIITDCDDFDTGFKNSKLLKILTGHMFIHTITITYNRVRKEELDERPI